MLLTTDRDQTATDFALHMVRAALRQMGISRLLHHCWEYRVQDQTSRSGYGHVSLLVRPRWSDTTVVSTCQMYQEEGQWVLGECLIGLDTSPKTWRFRCRWQGSRLEATPPAVEPETERTITLVYQNVRPEEGLSMPLAVIVMLLDYAQRNPQQAYDLEARLLGLTV